MPVEIEFGSRNAARQIRNDPQFRGFLDEADDARESTVRLKEETPEPALSEITGEAADSKSHEADKAGQADLTRQEREKIDFSRESVNVPKVRSIKGIAANVGVTDYLQFADLTLTVDENRELLKKASREERGRRDLGREKDSDAMIAQRLAEANNRRKEQESGRAKQFALVEADPEAQEFARDRLEFDIGFNRTGDDRLIGVGEDFDRLETRHTNRSQRARTVDEQRSAKITRDPIQWTNNPDKYDFPGIDTVQPQELHEQRSERAQRQDEREIAPTADTKQQWAQHPDRYDWPGVDRPTSYGPTMGLAIPEPDRGRPDSPSLNELPGLAPGDIEGEPETTGRNPIMGRRPSFSTLPEPAFQNLGTGEPPEGALEQQAAAQDSEVPSAFADDRDIEGELTDFGMGTDATQHRDSRTAEEQASEFGIDDRGDINRGQSNERDETEQQGFEVFGGGTRENETLF